MNLTLEQLRAYYSGLCGSTMCSYASYDRMKTIADFLLFEGSPDAVQLYSDLMVIIRDPDDVHFIGIDYATQRL